MDAQFYVDSRSPHIGADVASVTIGATNKAMVPLANLPVLGANYWGFVGKAVRIRMFGRMSTASTPGTQTFTWLWGNGTDANGTAIMSSASVTMSASAVNLSWMSEVIIRCRSMGATGTLFGTGFLMFNTGLTSTAQPIMIPTSAPAASASLDLTAANVISPQVLAVTSTTNTVQVHDYLFEALN